MHFQSILLTACLAFVATIDATPTSSKTSSVSTKQSSTATVKSSSTATTKTSSSSSKLSATPTCIAKSYDINFEDRTVQDVLPALNAVGIEDGIFFNSWVVDDPLTGIVPHSKPNVIVTANEQQLTNGTPSLTILYSGSKLASFDLHDFWFACDGNTVEGAASVAVQCTVTVAGFRNIKEVAVASFTFTPTVGMTAAAPLIHAVLPKTFVNLQNVTLIQGDPTLQVINADDFSVTTHTC